MLRSSHDLAASVSLIHCKARVGFFAFRANLCSEAHNPAPSSDIQYGRGIIPYASLRKNNSDLSCHFHFEYKSRYPRHGES